jgi:hypothetical protein
MAENNGNYQQNQNRISTTGITLFDENSVMLRLSYLDDTLSITIGMPKASDTGKNSYPEDMRYSFLITADRAAALYHHIILNGAAKAIEEGTEFCRGLFLNKGKSAVMQIRVQDGEAYLVFCKNINDQRVAENSYVFHFSKTESITDYDEKTGSFTSKESIDGQFFLFCKYIESGVYEVSNAGTHSFRKGNRYTTNSIFNYLKAIAAKLGVTPEKNNYRGTHAEVSGFLNEPSNEEELPFGDDSESNNIEDFLLG